VQKVLKKMKEHEGLRATPVIMISGRQDMDQIITCIQAGADDYLLKPFNPVLLQARISAGIERKRWHDREEDYRHQLERNERFIRRTFGRYLSDDIVEQLLEAPEGLELGGDLREVTIMMSGHLWLHQLGGAPPANAGGIATQSLLRGHDSNHL
jgi:YesN/AraC family two-component response regulator